MDADGSGTRPLTKTKEDEAQPDWSPDGEQIVFSRGNPTRLFVMNADGAGAHRLTDEDVRTRPSPPGRRTAGTIADAETDSGVEHLERWLVRPDGSQRRQLTKLDGVAQAPAWSPDGTRIAYSADVGESRFDIYSIGVDGKGARLLTSGEDAFEPAWSPDGETIAFSAAGAIVALDIESGETECARRRFSRVAHDHQSAAEHHGARRRRIVILSLRSRSRRSNRSSRSIPLLLHPPPRRAGEDS